MPTLIDTEEYAMERGHHLASFFCDLCDFLRPAIHLRSQPRAQNR
jgi:hypothetical protein